MQLEQANLTVTGNCLSFNTTPVQSWLSNLYPNLLNTDRHTVPDHKKIQH